MIFFIEIKYIFIDETIIFQLSERYLKCVES